MVTYTQDMNWLPYASIAAVYLGVFALLNLFLMVFIKATPKQLKAADPLVKNFIVWFKTPFSLPILGIIISVVWYWLVPVEPSHILHGFIWVPIAVLTVFIILTVMMIINGRDLPKFVPPEEGPNCGLVYGTAAGMIEEAIFRLTILPLSLYLFLQCLPPIAAIVLSIIVSSLMFTCAHDIGPGKEPFSWQFFWTRFMIPGVIMDSVFFLVNPVFIVVFHCFAHYLMPYFFKVSKNTHRHSGKR